MTVQIMRCDALMVKIPPQAWDPTGMPLVYCSECGHYEPWEDDGDDAGTSECEHQNRRAIDDFNDECIDCGLPGLFDPERLGP